MSAVITCDGCGKSAPMIAGPYGWEKPTSWFERVDLAIGVQDACSRTCIRTLTLRERENAVDDGARGLIGIRA